MDITIINRVSKDLLNNLSKTMSLTINEYRLLYDYLRIYFLTLLNFSEYDLIILSSDHTKTLALQDSFNPAFLHPDNFPNIFIREEFDPITAITKYLFYFIPEYYEDTLSFTTDICGIPAKDISTILDLRHYNLKNLFEPHTLICFNQSTLSYYII